MAKEQCVMMLSMLLILLLVKKPRRSGGVKFPAIGDSSLANSC